MSRIRVTKEFNFEMAHALFGYDGPCRNIHGHSYVLSVTVVGKVNDLSSSPKNGMVVDFSDLKAIVKEEIIDQYDHALLLNGNSPHKQLAEKNDVFEKIILSNFQPTCENMIIEFVKKIQAKLPINIQLHHVALRETSTSFAEWYADDNN